MGGGLYISIWVLGLGGGMCFLSMILLINLEL